MTQRACTLGLSFLALIGLFVLIVTSEVFAKDATLTWNANPETDLAGYKIFRGTLAGCPLTAGPLAPLMKGSPLVQAQVGKVTTYTDIGVPDMDGTLCYEITAFDSGGNESGRSNRASVTLNLLPPQAPAGLSVVVQ